MGERLLVCAGSGFCAAWLSSLVGRSVNLALGARQSVEAIGAKGRGSAAVRGIVGAVALI